jgi:hypothetical protein
MLSASGRFSAKTWRYNWPEMFTGAGGAAAALEAAGCESSRAGCDSSYDFAGWVEVGDGAGGKSGTAGLLAVVSGGLSFFGTARMSGFVPAVVTVAVFLPIM